MSSSGCRLTERNTGQTSLGIGDWQSARQRRGGDTDLGSARLRASITNLKKGASITENVQGKLNLLAKNPE